MTITAKSLDTEKNLLGKIKEASITGPFTIPVKDIHLR